MIKMICDKCGTDCELNAYDIRVNVLHNPVPFRVNDIGEPHLTDDNTRYRFLLCQKCFRDMGFPNPYEVEREKALAFRCSPCKPTQPECGECEFAEGETE